MQTIALVEVRRVVCIVMIQFRKGSHFINQCEGGTWDFPFGKGLQVFLKENDAHLDINMNNICQFLPFRMMPMKQDHPCA